MLGKLIKYEFKATYRLFLPLYLGTILFAILAKLFTSINSLATLAGGLLMGLTVAIYVIVILMTIVLAFVLIIQRFYKNLIKDEGYLAHTLPVNIDTHIWGKLIPATVWSIASCIVIVVSILIATASKEVLDGLAYSLQQFTESYNTYVQMPLWLLIVELCIFCILTIICSIVNLYSAMAIGQVFSNHKVLMSIVAFFAMSFIVNIITSLAILPFTSWLNDLNYISVNTSTITIIMGLLALQTVVFGAIYYIITRYIFSRRLNLE